MSLLNLNINTKNVFFRAKGFNAFRFKPQNIFLAVKKVAFRIHSGSLQVERFLILFATLCCSWFAFFDVYPPSALFGDFFLKSLFWQFVFVSVITLHLAVIYLDLTKWRKFSCLCHSTIWLVWFFLAITAARPTMATPLLIGLFLMGIYEAVRMKLKENG